MIVYYEEKRKSNYCYNISSPLNEHFFPPHKQQQKQRKKNTWKWWKTNIKLLWKLLIKNAQNKNEKWKKCFYLFTQTSRSKANLTQNHSICIISSECFRSRQLSGFKLCWEEHWHTGIKGWRWIFTSSYSFRIFCCGCDYKCLVASANRGSLLPSTFIGIILLKLA